MNRPRTTTDMPEPAISVGVVTPVVIGVCVAAFVGSATHCVADGVGVVDLVVRPLSPEASCTDTLRALGGLDTASVWLDGHWWRTVTAGFLHGHWIHLGLNAWSLWVVGPWAERVLGPARTLWLFLVSSLGGCLASLAWAESPLVVGASAGVMGLAGALWASRIWGGPDVRAALAPVSARTLGISLVFLVLLGAMVPMIAQAGHLGGLSVGLLLGLGWTVPSRFARRVLLGLGVGAVGLLAGLARGPDWRPGYHESIGYAQLQRGEPDAALAAFEGALRLRPEYAPLQNAVGYALAEAGVELGRAEALGRLAAEQDPSNPDYLDTVGWALCRAGHVEEGLEWIERASRASEGGVAEIETHRDTCSGASVEPLDSVGGGAGE